MILTDTLLCVILFQKGALSLMKKIRTILFLMIELPYLVLTFFLLMEKVGLCQVNWPQKASFHLMDKK